MKRKPKFTRHKIYKDIKTIKITKFRNDLEIKCIARGILIGGIIISIFWLLSLIA